MTTILGLLGFGLAAIAGLLTGLYLGGWLLGAAVFCWISAGVLVHLARVNQQ